MHTTQSQASEADTNGHARMLAEARQQIARSGGYYIPPFSWAGLTDQEQNQVIREAGHWLRAAEIAELVVIPADVFVEALTLIASLTDDEDCWFDHHRGCQTHGYLDLELGEKCPVQHARDFLAQHHSKEDTTP
jgi:hypothetical protein